MDDPVYRVYFWSGPSAEPGSDGVLVVPYCEEWRLTGAADVHEVLAWANGPEARGRVFELFVESSHGELGLLRLAGTSPTRPESR
ncbi:hypothetical protein DQ240_05645 [Blastococcus sp. TF02A-26]|nr:hypothetical protein DQ240_05645 [Blastococcus sp. TF02A-26]